MTDAESDVPGGESRPLLGCGWGTLTVLLVLMAIGIGGFFGVRRVINTGMAEELELRFADTSLLPTAQLTQATPEVQVKLFFILHDRTLTPLTRRLARPATSAERLHLIARELNRAPGGGGLRSPFASPAALRGLFMMDGVVWVDLGPEFSPPRGASPLSEHLAIYSIVNSLMLNDETKSLRGVRFMIEGRPVETAWGWLDLSSPLGPALTMIQ